MLAVLADPIARWPRLLRWVLAILLPVIGLSLLAFTWLIDVIDLCKPTQECPSTRFGDEPILWLPYLIGLDLVLSPIILTVTLWRRG